MASDCVREAALRETSTGSLPQALGLAASGELVSIVGGGGKSALLFALGRALPGRTVLTTTTRIFRSQLELAERHCSYTADGFEAALEIENGLLVVGEIAGEKAQGVPLGLPTRILRTDGIDHVVIEADGSRMRPTKAPAEHEPAVPAETTLLVVVAGIDALADTLARSCHRPERASEITGVALDQRLTPAHLAGLLCHHRGGLKGAPAGARRIILLNKVERAQQRVLASEVADEILRRDRVERVVIGALDPGGGQGGTNRRIGQPGTLRILQRAGG